MGRRLVDNIAKKVHMSSSDIGTMTYILEEKRLRKGGTVQKNWAISYISQHPSAREARCWYWNQNRRIGILNTSLREKDRW
jgi:hypothetical protein